MHKTVINMHKTVIKYNPNRQILFFLIYFVMESVINMHKTYDLWNNRPNYICQLHLNSQL